MGEREREKLLLSPVQGLPDPGASDTQSERTMIDTTADFNLTGQSI